MIPANSPFSVALRSPDGGVTLDWKVLDSEGRVHLAGSSPLPDFNAGQGLILKLQIDTFEEGEVDRRLEMLPVDGAIVEHRLGARFVRALVEDPDG